MSGPWLSIVGIGEDGLAGLGQSSRDALAAAGHVFGGPRHLALAGVEGTPWPVPFDLAPLLAVRGQAAVALVSGDPFWHGAGASLAAALTPGEWAAHPAPGTVALAAARLGWRVEEIEVHPLHAAPFERLHPRLAAGQRMLCLMRDGDAPAALAHWLGETGRRQTVMHVLERLGGPEERVRTIRAETFGLDDIAAPVAVALEPCGDALPRTPGLPEDAFVHDRQITKAPVRALTLAALAPRPGERLWDLGAGSGSVSVEWCIAAPRTTAIAVERRPDRAEGIEANIARFGLGGRMDVRRADIADLSGLPPPHAVFVGGGATAEVMDRLTALAAGTRLVANGVTLETEALLARLHAARGGRLLRVELAEASPLGGMTGWSPARPVVQWSVTL